MKKLLYILLLLPLLLASCVTSRRVNYFQEPDRQIPSYADTLQYEDYVLRKGDRIYVYVYSLDENISKMYNGGSNNTLMRQSMMQNGANSSTDLYSYLVDEEGCVDFPTLGKIPVEGLTTRETKLVLEDKLATLLQEMPGYRTISVEVKIMQRSFSIVGYQSGRYNILKEKMTILEALSMAGDVNDFADRSQIKLIREVNGETVVKTFDLRSKDIINSEFYYIEPNDILYIRRFNGYSFGLNHVTAGIGVVSSTLSLAVFVYSIVQTGINYSNKIKGTTK